MGLEVWFRLASQNFRMSPDTFVEIFKCMWTHCTGSLRPRKWDALNKRSNWPRKYPKIKGEVPRGWSRLTRPPKINSRKYTSMASQNNRRDSPQKNVFMSHSVLTTLLFSCVIARARLSESEAMVETIRQRSAHTPTRVGTSMLSSTSPSVSMVTSYEQAILSPDRHITDILSEARKDVADAQKKLKPKKKRRKKHSTR